MNIRLILPILFLSSCCEISDETSLKIGATTSLIGTILHEVGKERVEIVTIVPGGMCPGHFDVKPGDIMKLHDAKVILSHGFEGWVDNLLTAIDNRELVNKPIRTGGNWMVPDVQKLAAREITQILTEVSPENRSFFESNLNAYYRSIDSVTSEIDRGFFRDIRVICSIHQTEFLEWLGFRIISTYDGSEEITSKELIDLINTGKEERVDMVVDNFQSGGGIGRVIASEIGASYVVLTNFPLDGSYIESLRENIDKLSKK